MNHAAAKTTKTKPQPAAASDSSPRQLRVGMELADTTWRIAVPVLLFAGAGLLVDRSADTKPWLTLLGMIIGLIVAGYLVKRQLARWPDRPVRPGSYERNRRPGDTEDKSYFND